MKKALTFFALAFSIHALAAGPDLTGTYGAQSGVRMFGYDEASCKADGGEFHTDDSGCYWIDTHGNTLEVATNDAGQTTVAISVVFGPANERQFEGLVTKQTGNVLSVSEAAANDDGTVGDIAKDGCQMDVTIDNAKVSSIQLKTDACDGNLGRAEGAVKFR